MTRQLAVLLLAAACVSPAPAPGAAPPVPEPPRRESPFVVRPLKPFQDGRWLGQGIAYGPHRDGQRPGGPSPTREELQEDLALLTKRWGLLRLYSADDTATMLLALIREERLPTKVLLGAWLAPEARLDAAGQPTAWLPEARAANGREVAAAVRLANAYPDIVLGVCVGNETQVAWSDHRLPAETLIGWLREARRGTGLPVATADDFGFWLLPTSADVAREVDFLVVHVYAMWNGKPLDAALDFTRAKYAEVLRQHPGRPALLGEAGWATRKSTEGDQGKYIKAEAGEAAQRVFYAQFTDWVVRERIVSTWFEAFDEAWKGGTNPDDVEKHWGLYTTTRVPKQALGPTPAP